MVCRRDALYTKGVQIGFIENLALGLKRRLDWNCDWTWRENSPPPFPKIVISIVLHMVQAVSTLYVDKPLYSTTDKALPPNQTEKREKWAYLLHLSAQDSFSLFST